MITLTFLQLTLLIFIAVVFSIAKKLFLSSKWYMQWYLRVQTKKKQAVEKDERTRIHNNLKQLAVFMDWLDKKLTTSKQKKQFFSDFANSKSSRNYWINHLLDRFAPEVEIKITPKKEVPAVEVK